MSSNGKPKQVSVSLDDDTLTWVKREATARGLSVAAVIREMVLQQRREGVSVAPAQLDLDM